MKKIYLLIAMSTLLVACSKKPGEFTGNVSWKYNDYVGNKPDVGANIKLFVADKSKQDKLGLPQFSTSTDVQGNFKIVDIPPGTYLAIIKSKNTRRSPIDHVHSLKFASDILNQTFGFDFMKFKTELSEIEKLEKEYQTVLTDDDDNKYGGLSNKIQKYQEIEEMINKKASELIEKISTDVKFKIGIVSVIDQSVAFKKVIITEQKTSNENIDFGITYM